MSRFLFVAAALLTGCAGSVQGAKDLPRPTVINLADSLSEVSYEAYEKCKRRGLNCDGGWDLLLDTIAQLRSLTEREPWSRQEAGCLIGRAGEQLEALDPDSKLLPRLREYARPCAR